MKISLVIPAYNEEKRLKPFLHSIAQYITHHQPEIQEVLVVDDGSNDHTSKVVQQFVPHIPNLKLISHPTNQGKGAAVRTGVLAAHGDFIIFIDADGATDITELPKMLVALEKAPIAIGNRWMKGAMAERHSAIRSLGGWVYRTYLSLFGLKNIDTMCGFKGYRRDIAHDLFQNLREKRWLFDTEIAYKAVRKKYPIHNFPIYWQSKDGSKLSTTDLLKSAWHIAPLIGRIKKQGI